jgi:hypothetical protein
MSKRTQADDPLAQARQQLFQLEADIQDTGENYHHLLTAGVDHFHAKHQRMLQHLDDSTVDGYLEQAGAHARMQDRHSEAAAYYAPAPTKD